MQFVIVYMSIGLMYTMMIFSDPDQQVKTELMLSGMEIPPENKNAFRTATAFIMMFLWPLDMAARSRH
jgi:hypothetical protein